MFFFLHIGFDSCVIRYVCGSASVCACGSECRNDSVTECLISTNTLLPFYRLNVCASIGIKVEFLYKLYNYILFKFVLKYYTCNF